MHTKQKHGQWAVIAFGLIICSAVSVARCNAAVSSSTPKLTGWDYERLVEVKKGFNDGTLRANPAVRKLFRDAASALRAVPLSVTNKSGAAHGGSKNDFVSISPYLWPNPDSLDGLPFVYKDGETNPENKLNFPDWQNFGDTNRNIESLALAYFISGEQNYAHKAAELIRIWYVDSATKMNPNLSFAHTHPGVHSGHATGIIILQGFHQVLDAASLLKGSSHWTVQIDGSFRTWVRDMAQWLNTSDFGKYERSGDSNHGTHCNATIAAMLLYIDDIDGAKRSINEAKARISWQIEPDGRMPAELERSVSLHYTVFHLSAYVLLARLGSLVGVDLWHYQTRDGRSVKKALDFVAEPAFGLKPWPYEQIEKYDPFGKFAPILLQAYNQHRDPLYLRLLNRLPKEWMDESRNALIFTTVPEQTGIQ